MCLGRQASVTPEEIFAILLRHLVQQAAKHLDQQVDGAVITVPAEFKQAQRMAIRKAAALAGLDNVQLLQGMQSSVLGLCSDSSVRSVCTSLLE